MTIIFRSVEEDFGCLFILNLQKKILRKKVILIKIINDLKKTNVMVLLKYDALFLNTFIYMLKYL